jgi:hypothetical protein
MHRATKEPAHQECEWKHSAKGTESRYARPLQEAATSALDKQCLLMEVRMYGDLRSSAPRMYHGAGAGGSQGLRPNADENAY